MNLNPTRLDKLEGRLAKLEADGKRLELEAVPLPSAFGGIDPFITPLPADAIEAIGQLYHMVVAVHAENGNLRKQLSDLKKQQGFAAYQQRMVELLDKPKIEQRLSALESFQAESGQKI